VTERFIYNFAPGPRPGLATDPDAWTAEDEAVASDHMAYLEAAAADGTVLLAGRSPDGIGPAIVILQAVDEQAARRFMENDPFVSSELFGASLHPFRIALGDVRG